MNNTILNYTVTSGDTGKTVEIICKKKLEISSKLFTRLKLNGKIIKSLLNFATANLKNAKAVHDELEEEYKAIMDYSGLNNFSEQFIEKLFA